MSLLVCLGVFLSLEGALWLAGLLPTLRSGPATTSSPGATWNLVFAGDSVTYGLDLPSSASYPAQLGRFRAVRATGAEVWNLSRPGASLAQVRQQIATYEQTSDPSRSTRFVVMAGLNNCYQATFSAKEVDFSEPVNRWSFRLQQTLRQTLRRSRVYRVLVQVVMRTYPAELRQQMEAHVANIDQCRPTIDRGVQEIAQQTGNSSVFLSYPTPPSATGPRAADMANALVREAAAREGATFIDLDACFDVAAARAQLPLFSMDKIHLTEAGGTLVATCLAEMLEVLVPVTAPSQSGPPDPHGAPLAPATPTG